MPAPTYSCRGTSCSSDPPPRPRGRRALERRGHLRPRAAVGAHPQQARRGGDGAVGHGDMERRGDERCCERGVAEGAGAVQQLLDNVDAVVLEWAYPFAAARLLLGAAIFVRAHNLLPIEPAFTVLIT